MDVTTARRVSVLQVASSAHSLQSLNRCPALHHTFTCMPAARSDRLDRSRTIQVLASLIQHSSHRLPAPATTSCNKPHAAPTAPHSARVCESQQSRMCGVHEPRRAEARTCSAAIDLGPPRCLPMCPRPSWPYEFSPNVSSSPRSALQSPAQVQERAADANRSGAAPGWTCEDRRVRCAAGDRSASVDRQPLRLQPVCHVGRESQLAIFIAPPRPHCTVLCIEPNFKAGARVGTFPSRSLPTADSPMREGTQEYHMGYSESIHGIQPYPNSDCA
jgi:hypothetical protein